MSVCPPGGGEDSRESSVGVNKPVLQVLSLF